MPPQGTESRIMLADLTMLGFSYPYTTIASIAVLCTAAIFIAIQ